MLTIFRLRSRIGNGDAALRAVRMFEDAIGVAFDISGHSDFDLFF